ncbi:MAG TPA: FAD-dependent oxidoreductase [Reyranella sp.]|nr:FAD-dependent oxidoreductase [Reyranella sp.]
MGRSKIIVVGAGVAGLCCALELVQRGFAVEVVERGKTVGDGACSWQAGGMLAPWCEAATTDRIVAERGVASIDWWARHFAGTVRRGSLVVAPPRDGAELTRFAERTSHFEWADEGRVAALEPDLAGRFRRALFFAGEGHLEPRRALPALAGRLTVRLGVEFDVGAARGTVIDCRGLAARDSLPDLRGVRGEMVVVRSRDVAISRPVRLLHPRIPLYIVPRGEGIYMVGATMIESEARGGASVRSTMELLNAAYTLHPAFAEAEILELGTGLRPAFPDNLPAVRRMGNVLSVNGLFRHGFLLAPSLAREVADILENESHADIRERRTA